MDRLKDDTEDQEIINTRKSFAKYFQEGIILTAGFEHDVHISTDNITGLEGTGCDQVTALRDHIVELILFYEEKLRT